jgi:hypothetical protein
VAWLSRPEDAASRLSPPGFGVEILEPMCPANDLARFQRAYKALWQSKRNSSGLHRVDVGGVEGPDVRLPSVAPYSRSVDERTPLTKKGVGIATV